MIVLSLGSLLAFFLGVVSFFFCMEVVTIVLCVGEGIGLGCV